MRPFTRSFSSITKMLDFYSQFNPSPLSIKQFIDFGKPWNKIPDLHTYMYKFYKMEESKDHRKYYINSKTV